MMEPLDTLRAELDAADEALLRAFGERMEIVRRIAEWKESHGVPVLDAAREEQVVARARARVEPELAPAAETLYRAILQISRDWQAERRKP